MTVSPPIKRPAADERPSAAGSATVSPPEKVTASLMSSVSPPSPVPPPPTSIASGTSAPDVVATDWDYRVEGGQHLVFSYTGLDPRLRNKILRLRSVKLSTFDTASSTPSLPLCDEAAAESALLSAPVGPFLPAARHLTVSGSTAHALGARALPGRPVARMRLNGVPARPARALVQDDLARLFGPRTFAVEVKPKGVHAARSRLIPPADASALGKYSLCDAHSRAGGARAYEPADLLAGDERRALKALAALRGAGSRWLRVLHEGGRFLVGAAGDCRQGESKTTDRVLALAAAALGERPEAPRAVADMQAMDVVDAPGAAAIWRNFAAREGAAAAARRVWDAYVDARIMGARRGMDEEWVERVAYKDAETGERMHGEEEYARARKAVGEMPAEVAARLLAGFMLARAARDCSVMVSMAREGEAEGSKGMGTVVDEEGGRWRFAVHVIDLGPKPLGKIELWERMQAEMAEERRAQWATGKEGAGGD